MGASLLPVWGLQAASRQCSPSDLPHPVPPPHTYQVGLPETFPSLTGSCIVPAQNFLGTPCLTAWNAVQIHRLPHSLPHCSESVYWPLTATINSLSTSPATSPTQQAEMTLRHIFCRYSNNPVQKSCSPGWKVPSRQDLHKWSSDAQLLTWAPGTQHSLDVPQVHECIFRLTKHPRPSLG